MSPYKSFLLRSVPFYLTAFWADPVWSMNQAVGKAVLPWKLRLQFPQGFRRPKR